MQKKKKKIRTAQTRVEGFIDNTFLQHFSKIRKGVWQEMVGWIEWQMGILVDGLMDEYFSGWMDR